MIKVKGEDRFGRTDGRKRREERGEPAENDRAAIGPVARRGRMLPGRVRVAGSACDHMDE
ncbi:MAG: hypothetical protein ACTHMS_21715 [Jatrophihabitans sp.]|uniref:hypothetical protein n=1 Tax=Jatrophihabitans sp. TaxID=1932789 RepID=UPI003F803344